MKKQKKKDPCLICGNPQVDMCHIRTRGAGSGNEWWEYLYMCREHHQQQGSWGWNKFLGAYPNMGIELLKRGWELRNEFGVMKLRRIE